MRINLAREKIITVIIPLVTGIFLTLLEIFGKDYLMRIVLITSSVVIFLSMIYLAIDFLSDRELRWKNNKNAHNELYNQLDELGGKVQLILHNQQFNQRFNKLENRISYLEGRNETKKRAD